jgi:hypothetical protein
MKKKISPATSMAIGVVLFLLSRIMPTNFDYFWLGIRAVFEIVGTILFLSGIITFFIKKIKKQ